MPRDDDTDRQRRKRPVGGELLVEAVERRGGGGGDGSVRIVNALGERRVGMRDMRTNDDAREPTGPYARARDTRSGSRRFMPRYEPRRRTFSR